jgi:Resolvase, N terminal domain
MQRVYARGAAVKVLDKPHLDLTTPIGRGFLAFLSALAEDERERITKRAADGRNAAVARGVRLGRKPKLSAHQIKIARDRCRRARVPEQLPRNGAWRTRRWLARRPEHTKTLAIKCRARLPHGERRLVRPTVRYAGQHDTGWLEMGFALALVVACVDQTGPGAIAFTRMPFLIRFEANDRAKA